MKNVSGPQVVTPAEALESPLPAQIQEALGELVGAAREGLLALSVGVGLSVVHELMEAEVTEIVGPKGKHNAERTAKRHGHERGSMTLGGRRVEVSRPRVRTADDERELPVETYEYFADRDPLTCVVMNRILAGVSTRRYASVGEPVGEPVERESRSTGKSTVSELFIERTRTALEELMSRRLDDVRLAVMMLDGMEIADRTHVVALGITTDGVKIPLGLWEGSTENATLARELLSDLVERGLDPEQAILFVIDGGKAIRRAIKDVFGERALVHRCHRRQGTPYAVFYIKKGKVKVTVVSKQGKEAVVALLGADEFLGEGCLIGQPKRLAAAVTMSECTIMRVGKHEIQRLLQDEPAFSQMFVSHILTRKDRVEGRLG